MWTERDLADRPAAIYERNDQTGELEYETHLKYDEFNHLSELKSRVDGTNEYQTTYGYDKDNRPTSAAYGDASRKVDYTYDAMGRVSTRALYNGSASIPNRAVLPPFPLLLLGIEKVHEF